MRKLIAISGALLVAIAVGWSVMPKDDGFRPVAANALHRVNPDGTETMVFYQNNINVQDESGQWHAYRKADEVTWLAFFVGRAIAATGTYYSDSNAEDGFVTDGEGSWANIHDDTDGTAADDSSATATFSLVNTGGGTSWTYKRAFVHINSAALPDGATVSAATLSLYVTAKADQDGTHSLTCLVQSSAASDSSITTADFNNAGDAETGPTEGADSVDLGAITTSAYNDFPLNATGLTWISDTGVTKFAFRIEKDCVNDSSSSSYNDTVTFSTNEETDLTQDPKLTITYTGGAGGGSSPGQVFFY